MAHLAAPGADSAGTALAARARSKYEVSRLMMYWYYNPETRLLWTHITGVLRAGERERVMTHRGGRRLAGAFASELRDWLIGNINDRHRVVALNAELVPIFSDFVGGNTGIIGAVIRVS